MRTEGFEPPVSAFGAVTRAVTILWSMGSLTLQ